MIKIFSYYADFYVFINTIEIKCMQVYKHTHIIITVEKIQIIKLFYLKEKIKSNFIVPFSVYNNYIFKIDNWELCYSFDQPNVSVVFVGKSNLNMFNTIFQESKKKFNVFISHDLGHIFHMVEKKSYNYLLFNDKSRI